MLYNFFVSGTGAAGAASSVAAVLMRKFNIVGSAADLINSLTFKFKVIYRSFDGDFAWSDLGGAIFDIGQLVLTFVPAGKITTIVSALWECSSIL